MTTTFVSLAQAMSARRGNVRAWLYQDGPVRAGVRDNGEAYRLKDVVFTDDTAQCKGTVWTQWADKIRPGAMYEICNAQWKEWDGQLTLGVGKHARVKETGQVPGTLGPGAPAGPGAGAVQPPPPAPAPPAGQYQPAPPQYQQPPPQQYQQPPQQQPQYQPPPPPPQPQYQPPPPPPPPPEEPDEGPNDKAVFEAARMLRGIELDVSKMLWETEGAVPERPRLGLYVKLIWETIGTEKWAQFEAMVNAKEEKPSKEEVKADE